MYQSESVLAQAADRRSMTADALKAFCGFCGLALLGANYLHDRAPRVLSIAG
jgi:hypothetical protein